MKIKLFKENLAQVNSYLLIKKKKAILIDPGFNGEAIIKYLKENEVVIDYVILTHGHFDHIKDLELLAKEGSFELFVTKEDKFLLFHDEHNYAKAFGSSFKLPNNITIKEVANNDSLKLLEETFKIYSTPGHTKGSICISYQRTLFTGDTLFYNSVGRTDLYSGNQSELFKSIDLLKTKFGNDTLIYPGHGESGKMKIVKDINPFL
ncbi:MAG: MBL fold metallo-hydrolase [Tenericutes bacterium]|nr:MBL fold metallo-hydrolase [Mycoplasmatota bacterium]